MGNERVTPNLAPEAVEHGEVMISLKGMEAEKLNNLTVHASLR